jgi:hypothetical protein
MKRSTKGFTIVEALVSISVLTVAIFSTIKVAAATKKVAAFSDLSSNYSYFEDLFVARGTLLASNLLFWMNNVSNGCRNAGYFLNNKVPPGRSSAELALIKEDFFAPLNFEEHELTPLTGWDLADTKANVKGVKTWYDKNSAAHSSDPEVQIVSNCVDHANRATPGKDFTDSSEFRFCLLLKSTLTPAARIRAQAGAKVFDTSFVIGEFQIRLVDLYSGNDAPCQNMDVSGSEQYAVNRSTEFALRIVEVKNYHLPYAEQSRTVLSRSYSAPKSQRMLVNCNHCLNVGDPAFRYECSTIVAAGCNL